MKHLREICTTTNYYSFRVSDDFDMKFSISVEGRLREEKKIIAFRTYFFSELYSEETEFMVDYYHGIDVVDELKENLKAMEEVFAGKRRLSEKETFDYWNKEYNSRKDNFDEGFILHIMLENFFIDMHEKWDGNIERVRKELEGDDSHED